MGVVYEAFDRERHVRCALKTLLRTDARALYRFKNEFRALVGINHPNLVSLGELIEADGVWFFTMELVEGMSFLHYVRGEEGAHAASSSGDEATPSADTLQAYAVAQAARRAAEPSFDEDRLRESMRQLTHGLNALHAAGMVHRDIKPSNIRVTTAGRVVLLDFGLVAAQLGSDSTGPHVVGTAAYMAPEQAVATSPGPQADWYSVGVVLYEALTGRVPFTGSGVKVLMDKQRRTPPPPRARIPGIARDLDELCMELLQFDPDQRPSGVRVLEAIGGDVAPPPSNDVTNSGFSSAVPFVGRDDEMATLRQAYRDCRNGQTTIALIHGESGLGKSELVRQFTEDLLAVEDDVVVLAGRCYERETVPYKAFDGIADALSRYMVRLSDHAAAELLPLRPSLLPRLFPVLSRVEAIARAPRDKVRVHDPQELRTRMFNALRELLIRIGQRHTLVLFIDDLQWADVDSLMLLSEIMHPPDAPNMLLVATTRDVADISEPEHPLFGAEIQRPGVRHIRLEQLAPEHARTLASALSPPMSSRHEIIDAIVREAGGHPLYILEMVRHAEENGLPAVGPMRLEDALWSRIVRLPPSSRTLLEVLAVAGAPITREVAAHATRHDPEVFDKAASLLRVVSMARSGGLRKADPIECYHDRVRSAVLAHLDDHERIALHRRIAIGFERVGAARSDPHALVRHLEAAGDPKLAAQHAAEAGARAAEISAFDQAAAFFHKSLALGDHDHDQARAIRLQLGEALANMGRGAEAAGAFLTAAEGADSPTRLRCHHRAAEQMLLSGHIEEGLHATETMLGELDVPLPPTPRRALFSLLWHRLRLRLRGLRWKERDEADVSPHELTRLDAYKAVAHGLSMVDTIRGSDFQARSLLLAVQIGERARVGRALTMEAAIQSSQGGISRARQLLERAVAIAAGREDPYLTAFNTVVEGVISYFEGNFAAAAARCAEGERLYRDQPGTAWERSTARLFRLLALRLMGSIRELRVLYDQYLRDARRRGDRYLETTVRRYCNVVWMADDDPDAAHLNLERASWMPQAGVFHLQHWYELEATAELGLYAGTARYADFSETLGELRRSLLPRIQTVRTLSNWLVGRLALADGDASTRSKRRALARKMARRLVKEPSGYPAVWGWLLEAALTFQDGKVELAAGLLHRAIDLADDRQMALCAAAARRRLGEVIGGDEGRRIAAQADDWFATEGVVNADRLLAVVVPGFER